MATALTQSLENSNAVLRKHAKSFFWASLFLPRRARQPIAKLYAFCRYVDDISDHQEPVTARSELLNLRAQVREGVLPEVRYFEERGIERRWLLDLLDGAISDTAFEPPEDEAALDLYCYRVAGVVGLMMCPLLGVRSQEALQHAVDLGSAMQLTNIARDIKEDAERHRLYIPGTWQKELRLEPSALLRGQGADRAALRLLQKAEAYYASGRQGLSFIPGRTRVSIAVALEIYRDIGRSLRKQRFDPFQARAYVTKGRKVYLTLKVLIFGSIIKSNPEFAHEKHSHNLSWSIDPLFADSHPQLSRTEREHDL